MKALSDRGMILFDDSERPEFSPGLSFISGHGFKSIRFSGMKPSEIVFAETTLFYRDDNIFGI